MRKINLIYLLGAGRSGTTLAATILNVQNQILTIGEMHQFLDYINQSKECSCGESIVSCEFWSSIVKGIKDQNHKLIKKQKEFKEKEAHKNIPKLLFQKKEDRDYLDFNEKVYCEIMKNVEKSWLLDSSKYISRYLLLKRSKNINIKGIYLVRDVRGVVNSFQKQVQTPRTPYSTIIYYLAINFFGQIVCSLDSKVLKMKYEDFVDQPEKSINRIYGHIFGNSDINSEDFTLPKSYQMPHIVGGNRMKTNRKISIVKDERWRQNISRTNQVIYYMLALPFMLLNNYKV